MRNSWEPNTTEEKLAVLDAIGALIKGGYEGSVRYEAASYGPAEVQFYVTSDEESAAVRKAFKVERPWAKNDPSKGEYAARYAELTSELHNHSVKIWGSRGDRCVQVQVGSKTVTREVTKVIGTAEVEEPIYEWRCEPILGELDPAQQAVSA